MRKFKLPIQEEITNDIIFDLYQKHQQEASRIRKMKRYYKNQNDIMNRKYDDPNKPANKLAHNYAAYITNSYTGYFMGNPVTYKSENEDLLDQLNDIFMYNDEADENTTVATEQSICGYAYEIVYMDEEAQVRFKSVPTEEMVVVYDNSLEEKIQFAFRYYRVYDLEEDNKMELVLYTKDSIKTYDFTDTKLTLKEEFPHFFEQVPVADFENNNNRIGDFENVITLIDAYDKANSDTANDFEYFTNALLVVSGIVMADDEAGPLDFKNNRVLNFADTTSKAEYLLKDINDTALENYKNRLNADIHKFSNVVDMTDENFSGNLSGIALKYKFSGMENVTGIKEAKFKKGLMRRLELIIAVINIKLNNLYTYTEIKPVFTRNLPTNESELVTMAKSLYGIVSEDTVLSLLPFIEDVQAEKEAIAKEKEESALSLVDYQFNNEDNKDDPVGEDDEQQ